MMFKPTNRETKQTPQDFFGEEVIVAISAHKQLVAFHIDMEDVTQNSVHALDPVEWFLDSSEGNRDLVDSLYYIADVAVRAAKENIIDHEIPMGVR